MDSQARVQHMRDILDQRLTDVALLATHLCPEARVEVHTTRDEDEDARLKVFPPPGLSEAAEEELEEALTERCIQILEETDLFILCAVFDSQG